MEDDVELKLMTKLILTLSRGRFFVSSMAFVSVFELEMSLKLVSKLTFVLRFMCKFRLMLILVAKLI